ncbi:MAG: hypothetical protein PGN24_01360 [Microbacterium arborescens]
MTNSSNPANETHRPASSAGRRDPEASNVVMRGILIALVLSVAVWVGLAVTANAFSQAVISVID